MAYRCVASSPEGLVQQDAVCYLRHGYWWYVTGWIPEQKYPESVDRKLIAKYEIDLTDRQRAHRKQRGLANMQYIRHGRWFLLLATEGHHRFKQEERNRIRDCRRHPIKFEGYSISYRRAGITPAGGGSPKWHACVRIDPWTYKQLKAFFLDSRPSMPPIRREPGCRLCASTVCPVRASSSPATHDLAVSERSSFTGWI